MASNEANAKFKEAEVEASRVYTFFHFKGLPGRYNYCIPVEPKPPREVSTNVHDLMVTG